MALLRVKTVKYEGIDSNSVFAQFNNCLWVAIRQAAIKRRIWKGNQRLFSVLQKISTGNEQIWWQWHWYALSCDCMPDWRQWIDWEH